MPAPPDDWDEPTVVEDRKDTGPHDLTALARVSGAWRMDREDFAKLLWNECQEDAVRALYDVLRLAQQPPLTRAEQDAIVMRFRGLLTRL